MESDSDIDLKPPIITEAGKLTTLNLLPEPSKRAYQRAYNRFLEWIQDQNSKSFSENILMAYFGHLAKKFKSSTLWTQYSMLRTTLSIHNSIDIGKYLKLRAFLKRQSGHYRPTKSKIFTSNDIDKFIKEAPDEIYLVTKVALIMGIMGACRRHELHQMKTNDFTDLGSATLVTVPDTKLKSVRNFTVNGRYYEIYKKYVNLRPPNVNGLWFFINYQKGKCTVQRIGLNKLGSMGKDIAKYLKLPNYELYTGHCFRRSSATILVDGDGDIITLKRQGCWKSTAVAEECIDESREEKLDIVYKVENVVQDISNLPLTPGVENCDVSSPSTTPNCQNEKNIVTDIKETATAVNFTLMKLISLQEADGADNTEYLRPSSVPEDQIHNELNLPSVVDVLTQYLMHNSIQTKVAVLKWIHDLYTKLPNKMVEHIDILFPALQRTLSDESDQVVQQCLVVIAEVISSPKTSSSSVNGNNTYYNKFVVSLLHSFSIDKRLLDERGSFIIRQLCVLLNAEDIYRTLAQILSKEQNLKFASLMVEHLNMILLTSSELYEMRNRLKDLKTEENQSLFRCLYETWCHNPVATVALCLLSQSYSHVCDLIKLFGNLEVTVDFLMEIDKLVQLIESPIFAYLRLELLEVPCDKNLLRALYGLLMLLPQTEAFTTLRTRLSCIPSLHCVDNNISEKRTSNESTINFQKLLTHFIEIQEKHKEFKKYAKTKEISALDREMSNIDV